MKKYHKIYKVDESVCTVEQKITYNIVFQININHEYDYRKLSESEKESTIKKYVEIYMNGFIEDDKKRKTRYNTTAITNCLQANLKNYLENVKYKIMTSYEEIGKVFPLVD